MKQLWAPWRMEFIRELRDGYDSCIFCEFLKQNDDRKNLLLARGAHSFVILNRYPYNNGHLMIVPNRHLSSLSALSDAENAEIMKLCAKSTDVLSKRLDAQGFNCGFNIGKVAGAGIDGHIHMHVVPRWNGDNNFMPVLGETRSMPDYLLNTYDMLAGDFKA